MSDDRLTAEEVADEIVRDHCYIGLEYKEETIAEVAEGVQKYGDQRAAKARKTTLEIAQAARKALQLVAQRVIIMSYGKHYEVHMALTELGEIVDRYLDDNPAPEDKL